MTSLLAHVVSRPDVQNQHARHSVCSVYWCDVDIVVVMYCANIYIEYGGTTSHGSSSRSKICSMGVWSHTSLSHSDQALMSSSDIIFSSPTEKPMQAAHQFVYVGFFWVLISMVNVSLRFFVIVDLKLP